MNPLACVPFHFVMLTLADHLPGMLGGPGFASLELGLARGIRGGLSRDAISSSQVLHPALKEGNFSDSALHGKDETAKQENSRHADLMLSI